MTPTEALAALVAAVEFMTDSRWYWCRVEDRTRFATTLAQAQAVLAQEGQALADRISAAVSDGEVVLAQEQDERPIGRVYPTTQGGVTSGWEGPREFPATDPIERLKEALKPAPPDRTTWPAREAIARAAAGIPVDAIWHEPEGSQGVYRTRADAILAIFPTPEALAERIMAALRDELERPSDLRIITWTWLESAILRAIQETPR